MTTFLIYWPQNFSSFKNIVLIFNYKKIQMYIFLSVIGMTLEAYSISDQSKYIAKDDFIQWVHFLTLFQLQ